MKYVCYNNIIFILQENCSSITYLEQTILNEESLEIILQKTGIKTIDFSNINEPYEDDIPNGFEVIISKYPVKKLPETLKKLTILYSGKYEYDIVLPYALEEFNCENICYERSITFPNTLKYLNIGYIKSFNSNMIENCKLIKLKMKADIDSIFTNFPITLEELYLYLADNEIILEKTNLFLLSKLKILDIEHILWNEDISKLPISIEILKCKISVCTSNIEFTKFSDNIKHLDIAWHTLNYYDEIIFPSNIEYLKIQTPRSIKIKNLSNTLKILDLRNRRISIQYFSSKDVDITYDKLPDSLEILYLDNDFNRSTKIFLNCKNLKTIYFGKMFNRNIKFLPDSIEEIQLEYLYSLKIEKIPNNLKSINFYKNDKSYTQPKITNKLVNNMKKNFPNITILYHTD